METKHLDRVVIRFVRDSGDGNQLTGSEFTKAAAEAGNDISTFPEEVRVILTAMKRYGMFLADNGSGWFVSGAPHPRWSDDNLAALRGGPSTAFEVIRMDGVVIGN